MHSLRKTFVLLWLLSMGIILVAHSKERPNIIIIKADEMRYDLMGAMGHPFMQTPNIDRLAEKSFVLTNEFTVSPLCVPSRTSFFTGKYVHRTGNVLNGPNHHLQAEDWTFLEPLAEDGYVIGQSGKNHTFNDGYVEKYFDYWEETSHFGKTEGLITEKDLEVRKYLTTDPRPGNEHIPMLLEGLVDGPFPFPKEYAPAYRVAEDGIKFVRENKDQPFFLHYSFGDPHWPTVVPEPYYSLYDPEKLELPADSFDWVGHPFKHFVQSQAAGYDKYNRSERARILATYLGQISFVDEMIGMLLDELERLDLMENTVILFTSDHGNFAGNYGMVAKTGGFQESLVRIPGVLYLPELKGQGKKVDAMISNIDVMPTIFEYLDRKYPAEVQGESFLDVLKGQVTQHREVIFSEVGNIKLSPPPVERDQYAAYAADRVKNESLFWFVDFTMNGRSVMIRKGDWKYNYYMGDVNELYNLKEDPLELNNLIEDPTYSGKKQELRDELLDWLLVSSVEGLK